MLEAVVLVVSLVAAAAPLLPEFDGVSVTWAEFELDDSTFVVPSAAEVDTTDAVVAGVASVEVGVARLLVAGIWPRVFRLMKEGE